MGGVLNHHDRGCRSHTRPLRQPQSNQRRAQFLRVTAREARLLRMRMMVICMQRRPEKARQWLLRMNRSHQRNPEILQILSDLAAMQKSGVALPELVGGAGGALAGDGSAVPDATGRAGGPVGRRIAMRAGGSSAGTVKPGGGIVGGDGLSSTPSDVESNDVLRAT